MKKNFIFISIIVAIFVVIFFTLWLKNNTKSNEIVISSIFDDVKNGECYFGAYNNDFIFPGLELIIMNDYSILFDKEEHFDYEDISFCHTALWFATISKDREWIYVNGLEVIDFNYYINYKGYPFQKFKEMYGGTWISVGSGENYYAAVNRDGAIIILRVGMNDVVGDISVFDSVTGIYDSLEDWKKYHFYLTGG